MAPSLLGPPELGNAAPPPPPKTQPAPLPAAGNPFVDLMVSDFNKVGMRHSPPMGFTENMSATYLSSGNPCLDFFFHVVPDTPSESLLQRLLSAWSHDPLTALKLVFNLRGVRGTGKSDKEGFYTAALWLHAHHPKTLAGNISHLADFGYIKDMPEILFRLLEGGDVRSSQKNEWSGRKFCTGRSKRKPETVKKKSGGVKKIKYMVPSLPKEQRKLDMAKKVIQRYNTDSDFRNLHERVSDFFGEALRADLGYLKSGEMNKISLAAKWCPSIDSSFDRSTLLCESIAQKVFPRMSHPEYEGVEDAHYIYRVRDRLRKEVLVPLRKVLELPEVYIGANRWDSIPYNRVASVAMNFYKDKFLKHDRERFQSYLESVKSGDAKIAAGALLPHEIVRSLWDEADGGEVAELQWKRMVDDLLRRGKLRNCMAICDVSGSMSGTPMEVAVALGVLVSELSEEPWKGKVITFSQNPTLQTISGDSLWEKTEFVRKMDWGMNTNFQKVFDQILEVAVKGKLKEEQMIKKLFVFSDMEFDQAAYPYDYGYGLYGAHAHKHGSNSWETDYQVIVRKFTEKGYRNAIPQIVFWNLRDSKATPVPGSQQGVALVSGFSKNLLKLFFEEDGDINPEQVMESAISGEEYQKLAIMD
ncbi:unnamed protein product [Cuscuta epithymum]|uniref:Uncharacterized protein n=1 Tax=Cuscuta epithymum TaxID=186058 RepID=A0AAV0FT90_9ASTE|nr:unnamed protein product [Cuscuta epithymum]